MEKSTDSRVQLGTVRAPSGILVVIDAGYAGLWCHRESDFAGDRGGALDAKTREIAGTAVDLRIVGPDAAEAGRRFDRQWHPLRLYDIPRGGVAETERLFRESIARYGLDAALIVCDRRIPHRERVTLAVEHGRGAGEIQLEGLSTAVCGGIRPDREFPVFAEPMPRGPDQGRWRRIYVELDPEAALAQPHKIGQSGVDWARLMFADADALGAWRYNDALDGKADCIFWGRDAEALAQPVAAPRLDDAEFGWHDLPVADAEDRVRSVQRARTDRGWKVAVDFRPHSHHWQLMQQVRASPGESGTVAIGAAKLCGFMTSWGDGIFDILTERDPLGRLVRLTIDCGNEAMVDRQRRFELRWQGTAGT